MSDVVSADGPILDEIMRETHKIWHDRLSPHAYEQFYRAQLKTSWAQGNLRRVALMDGRAVLASVKLYSLDAVLDAQPIRVCGLGAVFTQPRHRGKGHARELIERVLEDASRSGLALALLFSEIGKDYYARMGFTAVPTCDLTFRVAPPPPRLGAPATLVRAGDERDLDGLVALGRTRAEPFRFHLDRNRALIQYAITKQRLRAGLAPPGTRELQFFVAEEGVTPAAYIVLAVESNAWSLQECGDRDPTGARIGAMLQVLLARDPTQPLPAITGRFPPGFLPPQMTIVATAESHEVMMVRSLGGKPGPPVSPGLTESDVLYWRGDLF